MTALPFLLDPLTVCALGGSIALLGLILFACGSARGVLVVATLALAGLAAGGFACGLSRMVWLPPLALAGLLPLAALFRSPLPVRVVASLLTALRRPRVQGGLFVAVGILMFVGAAYWTEWVAHQEAPLLDNRFRQLDIPIGDTPSGYARTDAGRAIPLFVPRPEALEDGTDVEPGILDALGMRHGVIRTAEPEVVSNCHGWVFTGGRRWVRGAFVETILQDNGYCPVPEPRPGDVAVFRDADGQVSHTALVRSVEDGLVLLESKWGRLGRYVHTAGQHAYRQHTCSYHRSPRPGHLLRDLDGAPAGPIH